MHNAAGLGDLMVGPYRWAATTYSSFIRDAYNIIKSEMERLQNIEMVEKRKQAELTNGGQSKKGSSKNSQVEANYHHQNHDLELKQFVEELVKEGYLVLGNDNWVDILESEYWDILKLDENGKDRYKLDSDTDGSAVFKKKSVVNLLKLIRDKIEHIQTYKSDMKRKLSQFFDLDTKNKWHFNENKFVTFWIAKFPKLVPYLWLKFYKYKEKLTKYYPDFCFDIKQFLETYLDVNIFLKELQNTLIIDMEKGNVIKRFQATRSTLEFRRFRGLVNILDNNAFITVTVNSKDNVLFSVSHSSTNNAKLDYRGTTQVAEQVVLIFADNFEDDEIWKACNNCDGRVIFYSDPEKLSSEKIIKLVAKFRQVKNINEFDLHEFSLKGNELSKEKQDWLYEHAQLSVQGRDRKICDIFLDSSIMSKVISGNLLNKLLRSDKVFLFQEYKYPEYKGVYIERKLYFWDDNVNEAKLEHIYVAVNTTKVHILKLLGSNTAQIQEFKNVKHLSNSIDSMQQDCEFILLQEPKQISDELIKYCEDALGFKAIRYLEFDNQGNLSSRFTRFPFCNQESRKLFSEDEFLRKISSEGVQTVYFQAKSGIGKTNILLSLGKRLENSFVIFCSFRHLVDLLERRNSAKECYYFDIQSVILEILNCKDECETNIMIYWIGRIFDGGARIDLQLDGLDEVPSGKLGLALKALEVIEKEFDSIKVWITSTKPLESSNLRLTKCSISPFSYSDKFNFFKQSWSEKYAYLEEGKLKRHTHCFLQKLKLIPDLNMLKDFTDYPLNCSMLADHYEDKVTQFFELQIVVYSVDLYESLTNKKFAVMYSEKKGIKFDENDGDFKMQRELYIQLHTYYAMLHLFPESSKDFIKPIALKYLNQENFCKMGIITYTQPVNFSHLTYADFFVARHLIQVLETEELEHLCSEETFYKLLYFGMPNESDEIVRYSFWVFVDEYLGKIVREKETYSKSLKWVKYHNRSHFNKDNGYSTFLNGAIVYGIWNLAELLIDLWVDNRDTTVCNQIIHLALISGASLGWFKSISEKLRFDNQIELVVCCVNKGNYEIAMYLIDIWCDSDVFDKIAKKRDSGGGIFHFVIDRIIKQDDLFDSRKFTEATKHFIRFVHGRNENEINRKDKNGLNFLLGLPLIPKYEEASCKRNLKSVHMFSLKELLIKHLNADVNERSLDGESVLCLGKALNYKQEELDEYSVEIYHNMLALLASKNFVLVNSKSQVSGLTPLGEAVHLFGSKLSKGTLQIFRDLGAYFNEFDTKGDTILHHCVKYCDDIEMIKALVEYGSIVDVPNGDNLCALCLAEMKGKAEVKNWLLEKLKLKGEHDCRLNCIKKLKLITSCDI